MQTRADVSLDIITCSESFAYIPYHITRIDGKSVLALRDMNYICYTKLMSECKYYVFFS